MNHRSLLVLLALCAGCVSVQADVPPICTTSTFSFQSPAPVPFAAPVSATQTFSFGQGATTFDLSAVTRLTFDGGTLTGDVSYFDQLSMTLLPPQGSTLPEVTLLNWTKNGAAPTAIDIPPATADLKPYLGAQGFQVKVSATGHPPQTTTLQADLCASGTVDKQLRP